MRRQMLPHGVELVDRRATAAAAAALCCCLSSSVTPSAGNAISADAPPDSSTTSRSAAAVAARDRERAPGRVHAARIGNWMPRVVPFGAGRQAVRTYRSDARQSRAAADPPTMANAFSIGPAALPTGDRVNVAAQIADGRRQTRRVSVARTRRPHRQRGPPRGEFHAGRDEDVERDGSVNVSGIGPGRKACDDVELSEKPADDLIGVSFGAESIELRHHLGEGLARRR